MLTSISVVEKQKPRYLAFFFFFLPEYSTNTAIQNKHTTTNQSVAHEYPF